MKNKISRGLLSVASRIVFFIQSIFMFATLFFGFIFILKTMVKYRKVLFKVVDLRHSPDFEMLNVDTSATVNLYSFIFMLSTMQRKRGLIMEDIKELTKIVANIE